MFPKAVKIIPVIPVEALNDSLWPVVAHPAGSCCAPEVETTPSVFVPAEKKNHPTKHVKHMQNKRRNLWMDPLTSLTSCQVRCSRGSSSFIHSWLTSDESCCSSVFVAVVTACSVVAAPSSIDSIAMEAELSPPPPSTLDDGSASTDVQRVEQFSSPELAHHCLLAGFIQQVKSFLAGTILFIYYHSPDNDRAIHSVITDRK